MVRYLVFGGTGFVGRNLVQYLLDENVAEGVCVVDKIPPSMSWLNEKHKATFQDDRVQYVSCNLANNSNFAKIKEASGSAEFDYVVNLASENKLALPREVYEERVYQVSMNCAAYARDIKAKLFVEISTAQVYGMQGKLSKESDKHHPKYDFESCKSNVEKDLASIEGLKYVVLRPGVIYGVGDKYGYITSQLVVASVYSYLKETMQLIWKPSMYINLVHVEDMCRALVHVVNHGSPGEAYNIVDDGDTVLDTICKHTSAIFHMKYEYLSKITNILASFSLKDVAEGVNEKHLAPWSEMCTKDSITSTPLSPFIYSSQLESMNIRASNAKIKETGFSFRFPHVTEVLLRDVVEDFVQINVFPGSQLGSGSTSGS